MNNHLSMLKESINHKDKINVLDYVSLACKKINVNPSMVMNRLLDQHDKKDIHEGRIGIALLQSHIKLWINSGSLNYNLI